jgi:uncharacterized membrane protein YkgB
MNGLVFPIITVSALIFGVLLPREQAASAGGFPAMTWNVPFLMKDVVLFAASFYLLKQDVARAPLPADSAKAYSDLAKV